MLGDGVADGVLGSGGGLAQPVLELGEEHLDRVQVGGVLGQEEEPRAGGADGLADRGALVRAEIVHDDDVAGPERRHQDLLDVEPEALAVDRAVEEPGASTRSQRSAARKVMVFQWPCGTAAFSRCPRGAQPRSGAMLVLVQVSSRNTRRDGSIRPWCFAHCARRRATSGRSRSAAISVFFYASAPRRGRTPTPCGSRPASRARRAPPPARAG